MGANGNLKSRLVNVAVICGCISSHNHTKWMERGMSECNSMITVTHYNIHQPTNQPASQPLPVPPPCKLSAAAIDRQIPRQSGQVRLTYCIYTLHSTPKSGLGLSQAVKNFCEAIVSRRTTSYVLDQLDWGCEKWNQNWSAIFSPYSLIKASSNVTLNVFLKCMF